MTPSSGENSLHPTPAERDRNLTILQEIDNATILLSDGLVALIRPGWALFNHAATFTALASGVERLCKVCVGMAGLDDSGTWTATRGDGHDLAKLRAKVEALLDERTSRAVSPKYINLLRTTVDADPALPHIFAALDAWAATTGRYGALDSLAGKPRTASKPEHLWEDAERAATTPKILAGLGGPSGAALTELRESLATSVLMWWLLIYRAWAHGVFGPLGRQLSSDLDPTRAQALSTFSTQALKGR